MNLHKILKILVAVLSLGAIISLIMIISKGDEAIKASALTGDTAIIDPMAWLTYIIFGLSIAFVLFFVVKEKISPYYFRHRIHKWCCKY